MRPAVRLAGRVARPLTRASRTLRRTEGLTILGWHRFGPGASDGLTTSDDDLARQLDAIEDWGATVLPLAEAQAALRRGDLPERAMVLTFDDGYASVVERAWPQLQARGWPATLFVVSDFVGTTRRFPWDETGHVDDETARLMTLSQLTEAHASGLDIGSHSSNHPWLPTLAPQTLRDELVASRADLEDHLGVAVRSFAYPTGGWNGAVRDATGRAGYDVAITVDRGLNSAAQHPLALRRAFVPHDLRDLELILDGAYTWLRPIDTLRGRREPVS